MPASAALPPSIPARQNGGTGDDDTVVGTGDDNTGDGDTVGKAANDNTARDKYDFEVLRRGSTGDSVFNLQHQLELIGYEIAEELHTFGLGTETALRQFQAERGLIVDGICGPHSWNALLEAGYQLGDRTLYYHNPMMRGDDIGDLQRHLSRLGFDTGRIDGIFGLDTQAAVQQFQHNTGLLADGIVEENTLKELERLLWRSVNERTVSEVREHERLRQQPTRVEGRHIVIGDTGEMPEIAHEIASQLRRASADILSLTTLDLTHQARAANKWGGDVYLGVTSTPDHAEVSYFATTGFESIGGKALAIRCADALTPLLAEPIAATGMRLPILRETRMPAVCCRLGTEATTATQAAPIAQALAGAVVDWCFQPMTEHAYQ